MLDLPSSSRIDSVDHISLLRPFRSKTPPHDFHPPTLPDALPFLHDPTVDEALSGGEEYERLDEVNKNTSLSGVSEKKKRKDERVRTQENEVSTTNEGVSETSQLSTPSHVLSVPKPNLNVACKLTHTHSLVIKSEPSKPQSSCNPFPFLNLPTPPHMTPFETSIHTAQDSHFLDTCLPLSSYPQSQPSIKIPLSFHLPSHVTTHGPNN